MVYTNNLNRTGFKVRFDSTRRDDRPPGKSEFFLTANVLYFLGSRAEIPWSLCGQYQKQVPCGKKTKKKCSSLLGQKNWIGWPLQNQIIVCTMYLISCTLGSLTCFLLMMGLPLSLLKANNKRGSLGFFFQTNKHGEALYVVTDCWQERKGMVFLA